MAAEFVFSVVAPDVEVLEDVGLVAPEQVGAVASVAVVEEFASPDTPLVPAEEVASVELVAVVVVVVGVFSIQHEHVEFGVVFDTE